MATGPISVRVELKRSTDSIDDTAETQSEGDEVVLKVETTEHASKGEDEPKGEVHEEERAGGSEDDETILEAKARDAETTLETKSENGEATSEDDGEWIPVADGALLRPSKTAHVHFKKDGEKVPVQLILFPEPYADFRLDRARITVVESDGRPVQVALLNSRAFSWSGTGVESVFTDRTVNFEGENDYRNWWCLLQAVRRHACHVMPVVCEAQEKLSVPVSAFAEVDKRVRNPDLKLACAWTGDRTEFLLLNISLALHIPMILFVSFVILVTLDRFETPQNGTMLATNYTLNTTHLNTTNHSTTIKYRLVLDPQSGYDLISKPNTADSLVRTSCWPDNTSVPRLVYNTRTNLTEISYGTRQVLMPLRFLFVPVLISCVYSFVVLLARLFVVLMVCRRTHRVAVRFRRARKHLAAVYKDVKARTETALAALRANPDPIVTSTVEDIVGCSTNTLFYFAQSGMQLPRFFHWPALRHELGMVIDIAVLFVGGYTAVGYVLLDWCRFAEADSKATIALPISFAALSVVMDVTLIAYLGAVNLRWKHWYKRQKCKCIGRSLCIMCSIMGLQVFLLLKMFTFFRASFFYVFSPLIFLLIVASLDVVSEFLRYFVFFRSIGFGVLAICGAVLLAFKTDSLYDEGTALLFSLPSWATWYLLIFPTLCVIPWLFILFTALDSCVYSIYTMYLKCSKKCRSG